MVLVLLAVFVLVAVAVRVLVRVAVGRRDFVELTVAAAVRDSDGAAVRVPDVDTVGTMDNDADKDGVPVLDGEPVSDAEAEPAGNEWR